MEQNYVTNTLCIRTIALMRAQRINTKHKNTRMVEQEFQLMSFLIKVAHQEVAVVQVHSFMN